MEHVLKSSQILCYFVVSVSWIFWILECAAQVCVVMGEWTCSCFEHTWNLLTLSFHTFLSIVECMGATGGLVLYSSTFDIWIVWLLPWWSAIVDTIVIDLARHGVLGGVDISVNILWIYLWMLSTRPLAAGIFIHAVHIYSSLGACVDLEKFHVYKGLILMPRFVLLLTSNKKVVISKDY